MAFGIAFQLILEKVKNSLSSLLCCGKYFSFWQRKKFIITMSGKKTGARVC